jgi:GH25 family lysozyme M1 (1,4-beta-N-acetylmuramidase)
MQPAALRRRLLAAIVVALVAVPTLAGPASAAWRNYATSCAVNLRTSASTTAPIVEAIPAGTTVTVSAEVFGAAWSASCPAAVSGNRWFAIVQIGGAPALSLFGVSPVFAATGLFRAAGLLEGIDVATWQGTVDYAKVKAAGKSFVVAKATEGIGFTDARWATNRTNAAANGLLVGGYHFARPDLNPTNPVGEADWFASQLKLAPGMLVPALDLEVAGGLTPSALTAWVQAWLDEVHLKTGARPMIYTSPGFWTGNLANTTKFADEGYTVLWVAHWFTSNPSVPANNWGGRGWTFWQYDDCGTVPGVSGCVDLDRYNGLDLTAMTVGADFSLGATAPRSVAQGDTTAFSISIDRQFFTLPVGLSVTGLPAGATAALSSSVVTGGAATLSVTTARTGVITPTGVYALTITAASNGLTRSTKASLTVTDGIAPTITSPLSRLFHVTAVGTATPARTTWAASDASGIASYGLQRQLDGGLWSNLITGGTAPVMLENLTFGHIYRDRVRATDRAGNSSDWAYGPSLRAKLFQQTSAAVHFSGTWTTVWTSVASAGSLRYANTRGASASFTFTGSGVDWVAYRGPSRGSAAIYLDGVYQGAVSLYSSGYHAKQVVFSANWSSNGTHILRVVDLGTPGHARIDVDGFVRLVRL